MSVKNQRWVTHFVEVLLLHSDSTDGVTRVDKFVLQRLLLIITNLKSYWWRWISARSSKGSTLSALNTVAWGSWTPKIIYEISAPFVLARHIMCRWIIEFFLHFSVYFFASFYSNLPYCFPLVGQKTLVKIKHKGTVKNYIWIKLELLLKI